MSFADVVSAVLKDGTNIAARSEEGSLKLTIAGTPYSVADFGTLLCWLAAAGFWDPKAGAATLLVYPKVTAISRQHVDPANPIRPSLMDIRHVPPCPDSSPDSAIPDYLWQFREALPKIELDTCSSVAFSIEIQGNVLVPQTENIDGWDKLLHAGRTVLGVVDGFPVARQSQSGDCASEISSLLPLEPPKPKSQSQSPRYDASKSI